MQSKGTKTGIKDAASFYRMDHDKEMESQLAGVDDSGYSAVSIRHPNPA